MIDSIDLIIFDIDWLPFAYLRTLGITIKSKIERFKMYWFEYKGLKFKFCPRQRYLLIITKVGNILEKQDITLSDELIYRNRVLNVIKEILGKGRLIKIYLSRIDYKVDIKLESKEMVKLYISLLQKCKYFYKYTRVRKKYETSMYLSNKSGQFALNFYDKEEESKEPKYKNILRLEIQVKTSKIKKEIKKGVYNLLGVYWSKSAMIKYYFKLLKGFLYLGDYYKIKEINKQIQLSNYSKSYKLKLKKFVSEVDKYGIQGVINKKIYCVKTIKKYIQMLSNLKINPIPIPKESEYNYLNSLYNMAVEIAQNQYFV